MKLSGAPMQIMLAATKPNQPEQKKSSQTWQSVLIPYKSAQKIGDVLISKKG